MSSGFHTIIRLSHKRISEVKKMRIPLADHIIIKFIALYPFNMAFGAIKKQIFTNFLYHTYICLYYLKLIYLLYMVNLGKSSEKATYPLNVSGIEAKLL